MKYKILAIILAIAIAFSCFSFKTSASLPEFAVKVIEAILVGTAGAVASAAAYSMGEVLAENLAPGGELDVQNAVSSLKTLADVDVARYVTNIVDTDGITVYVDTNGNYYASASSSLTGDELELATKICDNLNSIPNFSELCEQTDGGAIGGSTIAGGGGTSILTYGKIKTAVGNAVSELVQQKAFAIAKENGLTLIENGALPVYNFDFVGPMQPGLELPTMATTAKEFILDGLILTKQTQRNNVSKEYLISIGFTNWWSAPSEIPYKYCGVYIIYDNDIYFSNISNESDSNGMMSMPTFSLGSRQFKRADGLTFSDVTGFTSVPNEVYTGVYFTNDFSIGQYPIINNPINADEIDFSVSISPGTVEIPRNDGEQAVTDGLSSGIISSNPQLVLDENGNISRIDGIDTAKLMELLEMIANNGNISFDSIEGYLEHITHLLTVSNADANTLNTVVTNLNELAKSQSKSITDINTAVQAIAKAFEKTEEGENVDTDFSGLVIEHTGLVEATAIVEGMPIVQQCRLLLDNLFQSYGGTSTYSSNTSNNTNKAPNFAFYWDSNKDGKTERYNVLDLSFLEYQLSNENLEDKGRFNEGYTVRQFIQYLILLLCYVAFTIKLLKILPSLIGGAGEATDNYKTIDRYGA